MSASRPIDSKVIDKTLIDGKWIDGKAIAASLRARIAAAVRDLEAQNLRPGLAVVLIGDDPASRVYVRAKAKAVLEAGMRAFDHHLPQTASEAELLALIGRLNRDPDVHGILVQLPLPPHCGAEKVIDAIDPAKDVDGFHPLNAGRLARGLPGLVPCTPQGCLILARSVLASLDGLEALVIGRSNIVGKPVAQLLLSANATVTVAHSHTRNLPQLCGRADLLIAAAGRPAMVQADWIKPGATVIDVGINRVTDADGRARLVGDVAPQAAEIAGAMTPVPGGVGPMTIACLLANTVRAACMQHDLPVPEL